MILQGAAYTLENNYIVGPILDMNTKRLGDEVFESFSVDEYLWGYTEEALSFLPTHATNGVLYGVGVLFQVTVILKHFANTDTRVF